MGVENSLQLQDVEAFQTLKLMSQISVLEVLVAQAMT
jgi:hypothetical protein